MPRITIKVVNDKLVARNLNDVHTYTRRTSKSHIDRTGKRIIDQMRKYPPARSTSRYVRTYRLRDSWKLLMLPTGVRIIGDPVQRGRHYGPLVVGDSIGEGQAWMHIGTWLLFRDVVDFEMTKVPDDVERSIRLYARSKGL